jgi:hypothetical protein
MKAAGSKQNVDELADSQPAKFRGGLERSGFCFNDKEKRRYSVTMGV